MVTSKVTHKHSHWLMCMHHRHVMWCINGQACHVMYTWGVPVVTVLTCWHMYWPSQILWHVRTETLAKNVTNWILICKEKKKRTWNKGNKLKHLGDGRFRPGSDGRFRICSSAHSNSNGRCVHPRKPWTNIDLVTPWNPEGVTRCHNSKVPMVHGCKFSGSKLSKWFPSGLPKGFP